MCNAPATSVVEPTGSIEPAEPVCTESESILDVIPGYREVLERERFLRASAFVDLPFTLCGVDVKALTPRKLLLLQVIQSPFTKSGVVITPGDIAVFLWIVSTAYGEDKRKKDVFIHSLGDLDYDKSVEEITGYVRDNFADNPFGDGDDDSIEDASWLASIVDVLSKEYRWSEESILDMPLARIWQYLRLITKRSNPSAVLFSAASKHRQAWINEVNEKKA